MIKNNNKISLNILIILTLILLILAGVGLYLILNVPCIKKDNFRGGVRRIYSSGGNKSKKEKRNCIKFSEFSKTNKAKLISGILLLILSFIGINIIAYYRVFYL